MATAVSFADQLRKAGFRATSGKIGVLKALSSVHEPVSIATLTKKLKGEIDTVTIYRATEELARAGLVRRVDLGHNHVHYEAASSVLAHHHHLICRLCGKVEDVASCVPERLEARVLKQSKLFASIETHAMEFFGMCKACID